MAEQLFFSQTCPSSSHLNHRPRFSTAISQSFIKTTSKSNSTRFSPLRFTIPEAHTNNFSIKLRSLPLARGRCQAQARNISALSSAENSAELLGLEITKPNSSSWVEVYLPEKARPYAYVSRLNNQIGPWLYCWPYFWSIALMAEPGKIPDLKMLGLFLAVAFFTRNIACIINDILDRDIDAKVLRTRQRPLACGSMTPFQALSFLCAQMILLYGLLHPLNDLSRALWVASLPLSFTYPLTKRITHWSQAYFSITLNWGAVHAWAAIKGSLAPANVLFPLCIAGFFWTLLFETIYASQDKDEDVKLGLKSTAILFGDSIKNWTTGFGVATIFGFALTGFTANLGWPYYACLAAASCQTAWQIFTVDLKSHADIKKKHQSNKWFGALVFIGIVLGKLFC